MIWRAGRKGRDRARAGAGREIAGRLRGAGIGFPCCVLLDRWNSRLRYASRAALSAPDDDRGPLALFVRPMDFDRGCLIGFSCVCRFIFVREALPLVGSVDAFGN